MRPEIGRAQLEQETVGMEFRGSHGRREDGTLCADGFGGAVAECFGRGLGDEFDSSDKLMVGTANCEEVLLSCTVINGRAGPSSGRFIVGGAGADMATSGGVAVV